VVGYPPFLVSDKISTSQLLPFLTPRLLAPESEHVIDKSSKAMTTLPYTQHFLDLKQLVEWKDTTVKSWFGNFSGSNTFLSLVAH